MTVQGLSGPVESASQRSLSIAEKCCESRAQIQRLCQLLVDRRNCSYNFLHVPEFVSAVVHPSIPLGNILSWFGAGKGGIRSEVLQRNRAPRDTLIWCT